MPRSSSAESYPFDAPSSEDDDLSYYPSAPPPAPPPVRTTKHPSSTNGGERIVMTDDEDDAVLEAYKRRRLDPKKPPTITTARRSRKKPTHDPIVGLRRKPATLHKPLTWREDTDTPQIDVSERDRSAVPMGLRSRLAALQRAKAAVAAGDASAASQLRLPPTYDDVRFSDDERVGELASKPRFSVRPSRAYRDISLEDSLGSVPCSIAQYLRDYQVEGVKFLHRNYVFQEGCILGDDMGLGKTIQIIAFLTAAFGKSGDERDAKRMRKMRRAGREYPVVLIVCPGTLMQNWREELETWGWWKVETYHGKEKGAAILAARKGRCEVMITNYETYRGSASEVNSVFWDAVIADECHKIKERGSEITQRMNDINALCRIGLTGTAIQNKYDELWTLLNWCRPGQLGTFYDWKRKISKPLMIGQSHGATLKQIGIGRQVADQLVNNVLPPMFLRRMKTLIAHQLPKKTDKVVFCPLTEVQREAYEGFLESETVRIIRDGNDPCDCGKQEKKRRECCYKTDARGRGANELIFPAILWIQKLSNHLANWIPTNDDPGDVKAQKLELLQECLPNHWKEYTSRQTLMNYMDPNMCGKWIILQKLLEFWHRNGDKVLIFSYSLNLLRILHELFKKTSYNVCYLDGAMSLPDRAHQVDLFNKDPNQFVFLISTKAGGVGLNITAANKVVTFDPNWNPSCDLQAQDRAYRIGQTRDVEVFRLISAGTIEEIVYARQIYKQQQANIGYSASTERRYFTGVMDDPFNKGELFGLKNLFSFQEKTILQDIVNKTNVAERRAGVLVGEMADSPLDDDSDDDAGEDDALTQIADRALGRRARKQKKPAGVAVKENPIAAILSNAGVEYTHENSEVIGSSKVEAQISKRARRAMEGGEGKEDVRAFVEYAEEGEWRYNPPVEVRRRQMVSMARMFGFADVRDFALIVEEWSQEERRNALERFYLLRIEQKGGGSGSGKGSVKEGGEAVRKAEEPVAVEDGDDTAMGRSNVEVEDQIKESAESANRWPVTNEVLELDDDDDDDDDEL